MTDHADIEEAVGRLHDAEENGMFGKPEDNLVVVRRGDLSALLNDHRRLTVLLEAETGERRYGYATTFCGLPIDEAITIVLKHKAAALPQRKETAGSNASREG